MTDGVSILCPVSLLIPDPKGRHFRAWALRTGLQMCLSPCLSCPKKDSLSLFFLYPSTALTSSCNSLSLSLFYIFLSQLEFSTWMPPGHFKPSYLIGPFTWPKTTPVHGSNFLLVMQAGNTAFICGFTFHIIALHPHPSSSSSSPAHSAFPLPLMPWFGKGVIAFFFPWGTKAPACVALLYRFAWCFYVYSTSC